jgi:hypothetical protein
LASGRSGDDRESGRGERNEPEHHHGRPERDGAGPLVIANAAARRTANAITCLVSGTGSMESGIRFWAGDLQVNRQASLCDEFGGARSSK